MAGSRRTWGRTAARGAFLCALILGLASPVLAQDAPPPWPEALCAVDGEPDNPYAEKTLVCVPDLEDWNGILVVYAHGYVAPQKPLALPAEELGRMTEPGEPTLVERLLDWGFAFATTSYSKNGYAVEQADADLDALVDAFVDEYGPLPVQVLLVGASEGGLIAIRQIEQAPLERYQGGLALCAPVAGMPYQVKYLGDFRAVFDYFFPEVFDFSTVDVPTFSTHDAALDAWNTYTPTISSAILEQPFRTNQLFRMTRAARAWSDPQGTTVETTLQVLFYNFFGMGDAIETTGGVPYENEDTWYWGSFNDWRLNRNVEHVAGDDEALRYTEDFYEPTGEVSRPLVTLHTTHDPAVPYRHELTYAARVRKSGSDASVTQIPVLRYGHCAFSTAEVLGAFGLLVHETGGASVPALEEYRLSLPQ
jgi:pimeloyl-ACP methyl ester carboxylesterase